MTDAREHVNWLRNRYTQPGGNLRDLDSANCIEQQASEIDRLRVERDVNKRMRDQHFAEIERLRVALNNCEDAITNCDAVIRARPINGFAVTVLECNQIALGYARAALKGTI